MSKIIAQNLHLDDEQINFDFSLKFLKEKNYLDKFTTRVYDNFTSDIVKKQVKQILEISNDFLDNYSN